MKNLTAMKIPSILIVDDNPRDLLSLEEVLKDHNCKIVKALSGQQALTSVLQEEFCVILLDVCMPDMDGFEIAKLLRSVKVSERIPIIFITGIDEQAHFFKGYKSGAVDYLLKPINPLVLQSKVSVFIELYRQRSDLLNTTIELKTLNERMEKFVRIVSHDLRSPLNNAISVAELLEETPDIDKELLGYLRISIQRGIDLIKGMLDIAAIETGNLHFEFKEFNFKALAEQALREVRSQALNKEIELSEEVEESSVIIADGDRIIQVLINLLNNAIKFTHRYGRISLSSKEKEDGLIVSITDTGIGIPESMLAKLFSKYDKASTLGTEKESGTGLGLTIVQELLKAHGSSLEVSSEPGKGSCFSFFIHDKK